MVAAGILCIEGATAETQVEEIVVTASPLNRSTDDLARSAETLDKEEITRRAAASIGELLQEELGVTSTSFARGASRPVIRGLDTFRVRVLENGSGSHDVSALSEDHGVPLDPLAAQRIEILRGPAVLRYGSAAIGGAVSVLNDRIPKTSTGAPGGSLILATSPADNGREMGLLLDAGTDDFGLHGDLFSRQSEDYEVPTEDRRQDNTFVESQGMALGGSTFFDLGYIGMSWGHFESIYGIPGSDHHHGHAGGSGGAHQDLLLDLRQDKFQLKGEWRAQGSVFDKVQLEAAYSDYAHDEVDGDTGDIGSTFENKEGESRLELLHGLNEPLEGAIGLQFRDRSLVAFGEGGELLSPSDMTSWAVFLFEAYSPSPSTTIEFGARLESSQVKGVGVEPPTFEGVLLGTDLIQFGTASTYNFTPLSVSLGVIHHFSLSGIEGLSLGGTLQHVERAPDILELLAHGPHEATGTYEIGDPGAKKEEADSLEIALRRPPGQGQRLSFEVSVYHSRFSNFLFKQETGFVCGESFSTCGIEGTLGVEDELKQISYQQADATFSGGEAELSYIAIEWDGGHLDVGLQYDQVSAKFGSGGYLPRIPPMRYGATVALEHKEFYARLRLHRVRDQDKTAAGESATDGYTNLSAQASFTHETGNGQMVEFGVSGSNLLDEKIRNHVSFKKEDVLQPGRSVRFFMRAQF